MIGHDSAFSGIGSFGNGEITFFPFDFLDMDTMCRVGPGVHPGGSCFFSSVSG